MRKRFVIPFYYVSTMFNVVLPGGISGDGYKIYFLNKFENFPKITSLRILFYERVNGFYPLCFLGLIFALISNFTNAIPFGFYICILLIVLISPCYFLGAHFLFKDKLQTAFIASGYSWIVQLLQVASSFFLIYALAPESSLQVYIDYTTIFIVGSILAIIPISIGGAGLRELSMVYGFQLMDNGTSIELGIAFASTSFVLYVIMAMTGVTMLANLESIPRKKKR